MTKMKVDFGSVEFKNPVIAASGTFGFGAEYNEFYDVGMLGGISSKGLTFEGRKGNEGIRIWETPSGILNSVGLENPGTENFMKNELETMKKFDSKVIVNVGGGSFEEYEKSIKALNQAEIDLVELNISCPNVKAGGMAYGIKADAAYKIVKEMKAMSQHPLMVKLSPNAESIVDVACACEEAGADGLSLVNTVKAMAIDFKQRKKVFNNTYAGLSGPAIKPIALRMVHEVYNAVNIPIMGLGGIMNWQDAIEFIMVGATCIQIGTVNFVNPNAGKEIVEGIAQFMEDEQIKDLKEIRGII